MLGMLDGHSRAAHPAARLIHATSHHKKSSKETFTQERGGAGAKGVAGARVGEATHTTHRAHNAHGRVLEVRKIDPALWDLQADCNRRGSVSTMTADSGNGGGNGGGGGRQRAGRVGAERRGAGGRGGAKSGPRGLCGRWKAWWRRWQILQEMRYHVMRLGFIRRFFPNLRKGELQKMDFVFYLEVMT
jgi:hypothetical protein